MLEHNTNNSSVREHAEQVLVEVKKENRNDYNS